MKRFTVVWLKGAQDDLARIWGDASDKQGVTEVANAIDAFLAQDPTGRGHHLSEGIWSLHVAPLGILFTIRELDRWVEVVSVRHDKPAPDSSADGNGRAQS